MAIAAMTQLAETILDVVDWGIAVVTILIIWELFMTFSGKKDSTFDFEKNKLATWGAFNKEGKRLDRTKMVNQYLAEEQEEKEIQKAVDYVDSVVVTLESWQTAGEISDHNALVKLRGQAENAKKEMHAAERYFRTLKRDTWRNNAKLNHVLDDLEKFNKGDVDEIHQLEELILVKHKETADLIKSSKATLQTILKGTQWGKIKELKQADFTAGAVTIQTSGATLTKSQLTWLINKFKTLMLKSAFEKQTEAKKDLQGLMAKTREFYK